MHELNRVQFMDLNVVSKKIIRVCWKSLMKNNISVLQSVSWQAVPKFHPNLIFYNPD
jgi:hypothetical protein